MEWKGLEAGDRVHSFPSSSPECITVWMRVVDSLPQACQLTRPVSPALPPTYLKHQMGQQSLKSVGTFASPDAKHRCTANTAPAKIVWTSGAHARQQATKAALPRWADSGPSTKRTGKASLQRHFEKIPQKNWRWWRTMRYHGHKQVWMEACYSQGNRSLWNWKTKQPSGKARSNKGKNHYSILFVGWLLNVPATWECISGTDLLRQFYVLPHWDRSCRSNFPSHPFTVYWHRANQSQHRPYNARRLAG